jgi:hypothetical protein
LGGTACGLPLRPAAAKYSTAPAIGRLSPISHRNVPAIFRSLSTDTWSSTCPAAAVPAVAASFGNSATNSWMVASGSRPTSVA